jgi:nitrite reductase/ring-hydroxylating ferredoxin subunit
MSDQKKAATYSELPGEQITAVMVHGTKIALYKTQGKIFATAEMCTHDECSLEDFGKIHGEEVECTCHGAMFKIATGEVTRGPATEPLRTYKVTLVEDDILVEV